MSNSSLTRPSDQRMCLLCRAVIRGIGSAICPKCLGGTRPDPGQDRWKHLLEALAERTRLGGLLHNNKAVVYPQGIDLGLRRILDSLRHFQIEVRIEIIPDLISDSPVEVRDGHLRRIHARPDEYHPAWSEGELGMFVDVSDVEPRHVLSDSDFRRIHSISVIDFLIISNGQPRLIWQTTAVHLPKPTSTSPSLQDDRFMAIGLLIHVLIVTMLIVGLAVPFFFAAIQHRVGDAMVWGTIWWLVSTASGSTLGCWETWPGLSVLWPRDRSKMVS